jgi:pimeloyl-ACP methyl ester carboxylesterase
VAQVMSAGVQINFDDLGRGEPAQLFLPGWCANRTVFQDLMPLCTTHRRSLSLDWRGHGQSGVPAGDFDDTALVVDALAVIEASGIEQVVPVALAHSGWVAVELRRRLGERIPKIVLLEWLVLEPPDPFLEALRGMQSPNRWRETVDQILTLWLDDAADSALIRFVQEEMGSYDFAMWARAARAISRAYKKAGSPLKALSQLEPPLPVLHMYATPPDPEFLAAQQSFAAAHPWFSVHKLQARSHFPMFEVPAEIASAIEQFIQKPNNRRISK